MRRTLGPLGLLLMFGVGCGEEAPTVQAERRGPPPPAAASPSASGARPVACTRTQVDDPETAPVFKAKLAGFCLDPADGGEAMGEGSRAPLEKMCDLFDGECKVYEDHGVKRVARARYVLEAGGPATIDVYASRFDAGASAFAMFTKRVVGDGDPADPATAKPAQGGDAAAIGVGNAYVVAGPTLYEITYSDDTATPAQIESASRPVLEAFVKDLGGAAGKLPSAALLLPPSQRVPSGVRYLKDELVRGVKGTGAGAVGYYADGPARWRVAIVDGPDEQAAKSAKAALAKVAGAKEEGGVTVLVVKDGGVAVQWLFVVKGNRLVAIGDEPRAGEPAKAALSREEKQKRLDAIVSALP
jgi:hypothetical protein